MVPKSLLGFDIGSSSIKASLINANTGELIASAISPETEMKIVSPREGWAEQRPETWWEHVKIATKKMSEQITIANYEVLGIGISYQMHGLVMVDKNQEVIYPSIIWCDSRAVETGNQAFINLGREYCLGSCLNSPGNFTASKLKWIKDNKPEIYSRIFKVMLPGDYIAMMLSGKINTTISGLSEGIFWDFKEMKIADTLIAHYDLKKDIISDIVPTFGLQGELTSAAAKELGLKSGIPISYRAGDQPNNALSLNVLNPGEIVATAGTSGVIYGVASKNIFDPESRVNTFAHVNYSQEKTNVGVLLCINGTGIQYSWLKQFIFENKYSYDEMNNFASSVTVGAQGLYSFPFGNGAERVLKNVNLNANFSGINFNIHKKEHLIRAAQEGIAFSFKYGFDIMKSIGMDIDIIKAGNSNLFQSRVFREAFVNTCNVKLELYNTDGSQGAARGAGIGIGFNSPEDAFKNLLLIDKLSPSEKPLNEYKSIYQNWKRKLELTLQNVFNIF